MGGPELIIVLIIVLVIVLLWRGPKNLPKLGQALGRSVKDFRSEIGSNDEPESTSTTTTSTTAATTTTTPTPPKDEPTP